MDIASFLVGLLSTLAVLVVGVMAYRRRRRSGSPLILNRTLVVEPDADALGRLPDVQPRPPVTTSQTTEPPRALLDLSGHTPRPVQKA